MRAKLVAAGKPGDPKGRVTSTDSFQIETICARCKTPLRLISVIKTEETIKKILSAMGLPTKAPQPWPARPPPSEPDDPGGDFLN